MSKPTEAEGLNLWDYLLTDEELFSISYFEAWLELNRDFPHNHPQRTYEMALIPRRVVARAQIQKIIDAFEAMIPGKEEDG